MIYCPTHYMDDEEFEIGEMVLIPDIDARGVIMDITHIKTLSGEKEKRYEVSCNGQPSMLLKQDQIAKDGDKTKEEQESSIDLDLKVPDDVELVLLNSLIDGSLVRGDKEEFFRLTEERKLLLGDMEKERSS